jgi:hypothetical protein
MQHWQAFTVPAAAVLQAAAAGCLHRAPLGRPGCGRRQSSRAACAASWLPATAGRRAVRRPACWCCQQLGCSLLDVVVSAGCTWRLAAAPSKQRPESSAVLERQSNWAWPLGGSATLLVLQEVHTVCLQLHQAASGCLAAQHLCVTLSLVQHCWSLPPAKQASLLLPCWCWHCAVQRAWPGSQTGHA